MASKFFNANTDVNLGTADDQIPSQNAVKTYVDTGLSSKQNIFNTVLPLNMVTSASATYISGATQSGSTITFTGNCIDYGSTSLSTSDGNPLSSYIAVPLTYNYLYKMHHDRTNLTAYIGLCKFVSNVLIPIAIIYNDGGWSGMLINTSSMDDPTATTWSATSTYGDTRANKSGDVSAEQYTQWASFSLTEGVYNWSACMPYYKGESYHFYNQFNNGNQYIDILSQATHVFYTAPAATVDKSNFGYYAFGYIAGSAPSGTINTAFAGTNLIDWNGTTPGSTANTLSVKYDDETIKLNSDNELYVDTSSTAYTLGPGLTYGEGTSFPTLSANGTMGGSDPAASSSTNESGHDAYKAFTSSTSDTWGPSSGSVPQDLIYYNPTASGVSSVVYTFPSSSEIYSAATLYGSNDNTVWTTLGSFSGNSELSVTITPTSSAKFKYFKTTFTAKSGGGYGKAHVVIYGKDITYLSTDIDEDTIKAGSDNKLYVDTSTIIPEAGDGLTYTATSSSAFPTLSENGTMGGSTNACEAGSNEGSYYAWKAFDGDSSTYWGPSSSSVPQYITYYTVTPMILSSVTYTYRNTGEAFSAGTIYGSDDNSSWVELGSFSGNSSASNTVTISSSTAYNYFKTSFTSHYGSGWGKVNIAYYGKVNSHYSVNVDDDTIKINSDGEIYVASGSTGVSFASLTGQPTDNTNLATALNAKQDTLVSGTNIKTVMGSSLLGTGNVEAPSVGAGLTYSYTIEGTFPTLSANGTMGGTDPACSATSHGGYLDEWRAFDNSSDTRWAPSDSTLPQSITYYNPTATVVVSATYDYYLIANYAFSAGTIYGSDDNSSWVELGSFSGNTAKTHTVDLNPTASSAAYKYIKTTFTDVAVSGNTGQVNKITYSYTNAVSYAVNADKETIKINSDNELYVVGKQDKLTAVAPLSIDLTTYNNIYNVSIADNVATFSNSGDNASFLRGSSTCYFTGNTSSATYPAATTFNQSMYDASYIKVPVDLSSWDGTKATLTLADIQKSSEPSWSRNTRGYFFFVFGNNDGTDFSPKFAYFDNGSLDIITGSPTSVGQYGRISYSVLAEASHSQTSETTSTATKRSLTASIAYDASYITFSQVSIWYNGSAWKEQTSSWQVPLSYLSTLKGINEIRVIRSWYSDILSCNSTDTTWDLSDWTLGDGTSTESKISSGYDNSTISLNSNNQVQTIGVKAKDANSTVLYDWIGTYAEWQAGRTGGSIPDTWLCWITDDSSSSGISTLKTINNQSLIGSGNISISADIDNSTITNNASNQMQAVSLVGLTSTISELNYCDGVTNNIQTQLDGKATETIQNISPLTSNTVLVTADKGIYSKTISANTTFTFDVSGLGTLTNKAVTFELYINMATTYTLTFPSSVTWIAEPDFTETGEYLLVFKTFNGGTTWLGNLEAKW